MALGSAVAARYAAKKSALSVAARLKFCTWAGPAKFSIFLKSTPRKGDVKVRKRAQSICVIEKERRGWTSLSPWSRARLRPAIDRGHYLTLSLCSAASRPLEFLRDGRS